MEENQEIVDKKPKGRLRLKKPKAGELYNVLKDYSEYSSLPGLVYIFKSELYWAGRVFWFVVIVSMLCLGFYWSWYLYAGDNFVIFHIFLKKTLQGLIYYPLHYFCLKKEPKLNT